MVHYNFSDEDYDTLPRDVRRILAKNIAIQRNLLAALKVCLRNCEARLYMLPVDASEQKDILSCEIGNIKAALRRAEEGG